MLAAAGDSDSRSGQVLDIDGTERCWRVRGPQPSIAGVTPTPDCAANSYGASVERPDSDRRCVGQRVNAAKRNEVDAAQDLWLPPASYLTLGFHDAGQAEASVDDCWHWVRR
jgi:hypothetical protein